jgi:hypothetical protein
MALASMQHSTARGVEGGGAKAVVQQHAVATDFALQQTLIRFQDFMLVMPGCRMHVCALEHRLRWPYA